MSKRDDAVRFILDLNAACAAAEDAGKAITPPGKPASAGAAAVITIGDCLTPPKL